ncbi:MAG: flavodoxin domain-containing protein [Bacteroidota bacterium]|nr:flavodoxin domain-containing protein [Bacteroidota bacterium]
MKKIAIVYWPLQGNVSKATKKIHALISDKADLFDLASFGSREIQQYDYFIVGSSTVGADAWQNTNTKDKWLPFFKQMESEGISMKGKKVALFGLGDQVLYPDHFVDGMAILKNEFEKLGATIHGEWSSEEYEHTGSEAEKNDKFFGLALDEDNQEDKTEPRAKAWLKQLENFEF